MEEYTQVKADVPRDLKRRVFSALALRDQRFNRWVAACMEAFLEQVEAEKRDSHDAQLAKAQAG
jgi:hypothetical protein